MILMVLNRSQVPDEGFLDYLKDLICSTIVDSADFKKLNLWSAYFNTIDKVAMKLLDDEIKSSEIVNSFCKHLEWVSYDSKYNLQINNVETLHKIPIEYLYKTITYGTLHRRSYPWIRDSIEFITKNLSNIVYMYERR